MIKRILSVSLIITLCILSACSKKEVNTFQDGIKFALEKQNVKYSKIIGYEVIQNGIYLFLLNDEAELVSGLVKIEGNKFEWSEGTGAINLNDKNERGFSVLTTGSRSSEPTYITYGLIYKDDIKSISYKNNYAKILKVDNVVLWYIMSDSKIDVENIDKNK